MKNIARKIVSRLLHGREGNLAAKLQTTYQLPEGKRRIYHYHIRKTAGTSLNVAFFSEHGSDESKDVHRRLSKNRFNLRAINRDEVFVGWDPNLLAGGNYYYGFSHIPMHEIEVPKDTYTVTIFRDPVKRLTSHFNMLFHHIKTADTVTTDHALPADINYSAAVVNQEKAFASLDLDQFLDKVPKLHSQRQLYMFSKSFNVDEACENVMGLDCVMFTESFSEDIKRLAADLNRKLEVHREKSYTNKCIPSPEQISRMTEMMHAEYQMLERVKANHPFVLRGALESS